MKITNIDTFVEEFRNGRDIWSRPAIELAVREIERLRKENNKLKLKLAASENDLVLFEVSEMLKKTQARVQELEQERRWTSVEERLPEKNGFYYLHIHSDNGRSYERVGIFFIDGYFDVLCDKVTHWQPLPQPPKEGE